MTHCADGPARPTRRRWTRVVLAVAGVAVGLLVVGAAGWVVVWRAFGGRPGEPDAVPLDEPARRQMARDYRDSPSDANGKYWRTRWRVTGTVTALVPRDTVELDVDGARFSIVMDTGDFDGAVVGGSCRIEATYLTQAPDPDRPDGITVYMFNGRVVGK